MLNNVNAKFLQLDKLFSIYMEKYKVRHTTSVDIFFLNACTLCYKIEKNKMKNKYIPSNF